MMNKTKSHPSAETCMEYLRQYGTPAHVIRHCAAVSRTGVLIAEELNRHGGHLDVELIRAAGLLHDIARVEEEHWERGAEWIRSKGYELEAELIRVHMFYQFALDGEISEIDLLCLADRMVLEDQYVGVMSRQQYVLNKVHGNLAAEKRVASGLALTLQLQERIEALTGKRVDDIVSEL